MTQVISKPVSRYEARRKVTGDVQYGGDFMPSGMLHAALAVSSIAKGTVTSIDTSKAEDERGVLAVYTHETLPKFKAIQGFYKGGYASASFQPMRGPEIKYSGQPIAIVIAETAAAARRGAALISAQYERQDARVHLRADEAKIVGDKTLTKGDVEAGLADAAQTIDATYTTPFQHHNPMEMFSATAEWRGGRLTVWTPSQSVRTARAGIADAFDVPEASIEIIAPFVGGAFGSKAGAQSYMLIAIAAAKAMDAPVRLIVPRSQMYTVATFRPESEQRVRLGASADGKLTAFEHIEIAQTSRFDTVLNPGTEITRSMYACPNIHTEQRLSASDTNTPGFMRGPNEVQTFFALESAMDELALKLDMDPVELRRVNDTMQHPTGDVPFSSRSLMQCYDKAAETFGWAGRSKAVGSMTDGDWLVGYGCATATYPTNIAPSSARIRVDAAGTALVELAAHDVGTGTYTIVAQVAADRLGLPIDRIEVHCGNSNLPLAIISGGSTTAAAAGSAVHLACVNAAREIARTLAGRADSPFAKVDPESVRLERGEMIAGDGDQRMRLTDALGTLPRGHVTAHGDWAHDDLPDEKLKATYAGGFGVLGPVGPKYAMFAFGAEFVEVRVHKWTREIRVPRMHGAFAAGTILNPKTARSQLSGGMIWGIGSALHEQTEVDEARAAFLNKNIAEYLIPVNADVREVRVELIEEQDDYVNPLGVKGIGELSIVGTAAAIANAIHHATGKRLRRLPMKISDVLST
ncbi:MAG: xanthine dehydrogenase family protein molybdopterin-binding subunit [Pseudomonadota bacterium]